MTDIKQEGNLYIIDEVNNTLTVDGANIRVGIGNNNPGHSLSVTGDGNFTANLSAGTNLFLVDAGNSRITMGTTTAVAGNVLTVVGNTDIAGTTNTTTLQLGGTTVTATATELNQLSGITLGTAASANTGDFATAAQGALADTATQPGDNVSTLINDAGYTTNAGTVTSVALSGGTTGLTVSGSPITSSGTITLAGTLAIANGGTGSTTASAARTALGVAIGSDVQAYNANLTTIAGLSNADSNFIVGSATGWVVESGATARASLGLGSAATSNTGDFATAAQGALADTALQIVAVDGVTITGDGTVGNPLVAAGGGIAIGDAVGSGTAGSLLFVDASTNLGQDNSNLFWDDTNNRLGVGTQSPSWTLEVNGGNANQIAVFRSTDATARVNFSDSSTTSDTHVGIGAVGNDVRIWANNQIVLSGASSGNINFNSGKLANYNGTAPLDGQLLIGDAAGGVWDAATLTAGSGITITNGAGSILIEATGGGGGTPGGNPGDVQINDGLGGFAAAAVLQDIDYVQLGQSENDVFNAGASVPFWGPPGPPATIQEAIDRLAAFVGGNLGPIP